MTLTKTLSFSFAISKGEATNVYLISLTCTSPFKSFSTPINLTKHPNLSTLVI